MRKLPPSDELIKGILNSYSQVFFATNQSFAIILILVSMIDPNSGIAGFISVMVANLTAIGLGFNRKEVEKGLYGFNSLLVGLGVGYYFQANIQLLFIVVATSILTLFFVTLFKGILQKYALPYLSIPFLFGLWTIMLSSGSFETLGISERGIYTLNKLYGLGGAKLVSFYESIQDIPLNKSLQIYFNSIGAIFFQFKALAGIFISIGILMYSRIAFLLSLYGFYIAYLFYTLLGGDIYQLSYTYIGFNYILTAIAIGGYFMIPSKKTFIWLLLLIPLVTLVTLSLSKIFAHFNLSVYSLPFNIVVIMFLYALKWRVSPGEDLTEVLVQQGLPENNLYSYQNQKINAFHRNLIPFKLPFYGKWTVSQGHEGEYTHKEDWRFAWDFVVLDEKGLQYNNEGYYPQDYYCYGKSVISPGAGTIEEIVDNIPDNEIGKANLTSNWGNSVIIKHAEYLYSSLNHLKPGSITVKVGDNVVCGQKVGEAGNSGRSPYPHLHFQFQATPYIGSETINYPFSYFMVNNESGYLFKTFDNPLLNQLISNIDTSILMRQSFAFVPGQKLKVRFTVNRIPGEATWEIYTNAYNHSYIYDPESKSIAYYVNDGNLLYFTHFEGSRKSVLYHFYLGFYKVLQSTYQDVELSDELPQNATFKFPWLSLQDFIAPFYLFLKSSYTSKLISIDNPYQPNELIFKSVVKNLVAKKEIGNKDFTITISPGKIKFKMKTKLNEIEAEIQ
ncbi:MAG: urea transporter [Bacteroidales bacterium]|nr:urea transporter [Bacteroidales bacterium]MCF8389691.1 urea transporter [Bacteroidales bacterium]